MEGWECRKCGQVWAPFVRKCEDCKPKTVTTTDPYPWQRVRPLGPFECPHPDPWRDQPFYKVICDDIGDRGRFGAQQ